MLSATQVTARDIHNSAIDYRMPIPTIGQAVRFWPQGDVTPNRAEIGIVTKVNMKTVDLAVRGNAGHKAVKHVTDPRLSMDVAQRQFGAWDFTEDFVERLKTDLYVMDRLEEVFSRVEEVERAAGITFQKTPQSVSNSEKAIELNEKRKRARELGATDSHRMNKKELDAFVAGKEAELAEKEARRLMTPEQRAEADAAKKAPPPAPQAANKSVPPAKQPTAGDL